MFSDWTADAINELLDWYIHHKNTRIVWAKAAQHVQDMYGLTVTGEQCRLRIKGEKAKYFRLKKSNNSSGSDGKHIPSSLEKAFADSYTGNARPLNSNGKY